MIICHVCRCEVKVGQRVIKTYILTNVSPEGSISLDDTGLNHASCYDTDINDPRYDEDGNEIDERSRRGYVKGNR